MKTQQTFKVVMLPTEKAENCIAMYHNNKISYTTELLTKAYRDSANIKVFQLYIISDDEIKEGDWVYDNYRKVLLQAIDKANTTFFNMSLHRYKKIVATTDKSLTKIDKTGIAFETEYLLPQIPESFIQAYIKSYNESKVIEEVDLEIESEYVKGNYSNICCRCKKEFMWTDKLGFVCNDCANTRIKTRPDNTVIVHQSKMYSRDEVIEILNKYNLDNTGNNWDEFINVDEWSKEHL